ncbi:unnamed protein product, partial [Vitis vinifera]
MFGTGLKSHVLEACRSREDGTDLRTPSTLESMAALTVTFSSSVSRTWIATQKTCVTSWEIGDNLARVSSGLTASKAM